MQFERNIEKDNQEAFFVKLKLLEQSVSDEQSSY